MHNIKFVYRWGTKLKGGPVTIQYKKIEYFKFALNPKWNGRTNLRGESSYLVGESFDPNPSANLVSVESEGD